MQDSRFNVALSRGEWIVAWRLLLLFCLLYIYELSHFNITVDDEILAQSGTCHFADLGRWVYPLLRATLWPSAVLPSGPLLLFGCAFVVSFIYTARLFNVTRFGLFHYVAFAAYALFPTWFAQLEFAANVLPDAVGLLATTWAALLTFKASANSQQRERWRCWLLAAGSVICCAVAIGSYQSLGLMYLALVLCAGLAARLDESAPAWSRLVRTVIQALLVLALGFLFSLVIGRLVMQACHLTPSAYGISDLHFGEALRHPLSALKLGVHQMGQLYFGFWHPFGRQVGLIYVTTILLCGCGIVVLVPRGARWQVGGVILMLLMMPAGLRTYPQIM